jgi:hypothetical protein
MPTYFARKAGNINAADVWATTPSGTAAAVTFAAGDVLMANSFAITVNVSIDLGITGQVRNDTFGSAANGGGFTLKPDQTLTAAIFPGTVASCLTFADAGSTYVVGKINANATNVSTSGIFNNSSTGTVFVTGSVVGSSGGANAVGITNSAGGVINVTGSVLGGSGTAIRNSAAGTIIVTGPVEAGLGASGFGHGIINAAAGILQIVGSVTASANLPAISSTNASSVVRVSGSFIHAVNGQVPVAANRILLNTTPILSITRYAVNGTGTYFDMFTADNTGFGPATGNVRAGVSYGGGLVGTCAVPAAGSVALGVPVDATTGTAVLDPAAVASAVWGAATRTITGGTVDTLTNSPDVPTEAEIASAVWGAATRSVTGGTVDTLTNAPTSVTPTDIWTHATRTITGGTVDTLTNAPTVPTAAAIADEVRVELATELGRIDAPVSSASAPTASTVATAVRSELATELAHLDADISTRATPADIPASDISSIKSTTDALNTDRLAQCSTVATTGSQLAAALS